MEKVRARCSTTGSPACSQQLMFPMALFQMDTTATELLAMLVLVALVDGASFALRRWLTR